MITCYIAVENDHIYIFKCTLEGVLGYSCSGGSRIFKRKFLKGSTQA